mmetsp:Transcript_43519/g.114851  ORF Transcript_43519/g.114851 Transcript_43519/m.114851 type:complete len:621 (-) Transcript_43519:537-2399(-)
MPRATARGKNVAETKREVLEGICAQCFAKASLCCSKCKQAWFCSEKCLKKGWLLGHKGDCGLDLARQEIPAVPAGYQANVETPVLPEATWRRLSEVEIYPSCPKGFPNLGNSCYLNASLQCLASMPVFNSFFSDHIRSASCRSNAGSRCFRCDVGHAFEKCRRNILTVEEQRLDPGDLREGDWVRLHSLGATQLNHLEGVVQTCPVASDPEGRYGVRIAGTSECKSVKLQNLVRAHPPVGPREVVQWLPRLADAFTFGAQEDAHEFYRSVLRLLGDEQMQEYQQALSEPLTGALAMSTELTTIPSRVFGGLLVSQCTCTESGCGFATHSFETFQDLSLDISEVTETIEEMLQLFTAPERLDKNNRWQCDGCGKSVRARKRIMINQAPDCLVLHLKRFRVGFHGKVNQPVRFHSTLNLRPFLANSSNDRPLYELRGVLVHLDYRNISNYGHYIAYVKCLVQTDVWQWFLMDDERCVAVTEEEVLKQTTAYVLFYTRSGTSAKKDSGGTPSQPAALQRPSSGEANSSAPTLQRCAAEHGCSFFAVPGQALCSLCYRGEFGTEPPKLESEPLEAPPETGKESRETASGGQRSEPTKTKKKIGANDLCPCGSGSKYKKCHGAKA